MGLSDFSDYDATKLIVGTFFGVRHFDWWPGKKTKREPRLYSPSYEYMWKDGENQAECQCYRGAYGYSNDVAAKNHHCGFYAYYDDDHYQFGDRNAIGVIEAYGRLTVGSRGFRAEKAKIVGLAIKDWTLDDWIMFETNYPSAELFDDKDTMFEKFPLSAPPPEPPPPPPPGIDEVALAFRNNQCPHCKGQMLFAPATSEFLCQPCNLRWPGAFVVNAIHAGYRR